MAALLREEFSREVAAQRGQHPDAEMVLLMSALDSPPGTARNHVLLADWSRALALGILATLVAMWWNDAKALCEALIPSGVGEWSWVIDLALAGTLLALSLPCTRMFGRTT